ncbi:MAG: hypothetical protein FWD59_01245 [Micrococcales bacterium]|nr:hypothetical protein [Micrococcales bacterium]
MAKLRQLQGIKALFVIDYSEFRGPAIAKLIAMLEEEDLLPRTRILLLARTAGEWWRRLQLSNGMESHIEPLAHQLESVLKGQDAVSLDKLWKRSTSAFAAAARNAGIPCVDSPPRPERTSSYTTLGFYADALLSTVDTGDGRLSGDDRAPLARLLGHERRYFGSVLAQSGLSIAGVQQDWALATCSLRLPSSTSEAMLAVSAVEMLGEVDAAALTDAIATAFPSSSTNQVWAGLSLDPVVDLLLDDLASSARTDTDWLRNALGMFADLDDDSGLYAAQVLTRALRESKPGTGQERLVSLLHELILVQPNSVAAPICISDPPSQLHEALSEAVMSRRMDSRHFAVVSESMSCLLRSIMTPELTLAVRRREAAESRWHAEEGTGEYRTYVRAVIDLCLVLRVLDRAADTVDELGICVEVLEDAHARDGDKLADLLLAQLEYIEALYLCDRSEAARPVIERVRHLLQKQVPEVRIDPLLSVQLGGFVASVSVLPDGSNYEAVGFEHRKALERLVPDPRSAYAIGREWGRYSRFAWAHRDVSRAITAGLRSAEVFSEFGFAEKRVEQLAILSWCWQRFGDGSDPDSLREIAGYLWDAYSELAGYRKEGLAVRVARGLHPIIEAPPVEMAGHDYYVMVMMAIRALTILDEREQADSVLIADYVTHLAENLDRCPKEDVLSFRRDADDIVSAEIASNPEIFCELGDTVIGLLEGAGLSGSQRLLDAIKIAGRAPGGTTGGG